MVVVYLLIPASIVVRPCRGVSFPSLPRRTLPIVCRQLNDLFSLGTQNALQRRVSDKEQLLYHPRLSQAGFLSNRIEWKWHKRANDGVLSIHFRHWKLCFIGTVEQQTPIKKHTHTLILPTISFASMVLIAKECSKLSHHPMPWAGARVEATAKGDPGSIESPLLGSGPDRWQLSVCTGP